MIVGGSLPERLSVRLFSLRLSMVFLLLPYPELKFPFLIDLSGWKAEKPDGADIDMAGQISISAARKYSSGDKNFEAVILIGQMMMGAWNIGYQEGFKMETPDIMMEVKNINGFMVFNSYEKNKSSGLIMVLLNEATAEGNTGAVFSFLYKGMNGEEAVKLAQKFDWKKVKAKVGKIK